MRYFKTAVPMATYLLLAGASAARAEPIVNESGTMQTFSLTTTGFMNGVNIVSISFPDNEFVTSQNGVRVNDVPANFSAFKFVISNPTTVNGLTNFNVTWLSTMAQITPTGAQGGGSAPFSYFFDSGTSFASAQGDFFNLGLDLVGMGRNTTAFDFSPFQSGGSLRETFTSSLNTGGASLADVLLSSAPASAVGSGAFSQVANSAPIVNAPRDDPGGIDPGDPGDITPAGPGAAAPEPMSAVLLGTGVLLGGCWVRRRRAARQVAVT
jgi:hypothetical protein